MLMLTKCLKKYLTIQQNVSNIKIS